MPAHGLSIPYEDEHLLVVDKPAGLVTHPGKGNREGTLSQLLAGVAEGGDPERPGIVHRLDRGTSGLMVVAKSSEAHARLQEAIAKRTLTREYLTLVEGRPPSRTGTIEAPIGRDRAVRTRMAVGGVRARAARTRFVYEREVGGHHRKHGGGDRKPGKGARQPDAGRGKQGGFSLLRVTLETGRTHQIRVHMSAIGHPVCGDPEYGTPGLLGLERQFLHSTRLRFDHPIDGQEIDLESPLPEDLRAALARAEALPPD